MVYSLSQISEIANSGLSDEQIEEIKVDNGEVLIVPDYTDEQEMPDISIHQTLDLLCEAAKRFNDAGFSCEFTISLDDFFRFSSGAEFAEKAKALADLGVALRVLPNCLSHITVQEVLTDEQCDLFKAATDVCRAAGLDCSFDAQRFSVEQTLSASRKLNAWLHEIKNANVNGTPLSPFEQFVYTYDIVSRMPYNNVADGEDMDLPRKLIYVLNSDKIVCVGFAAIFVHILNSLGIACEVLIVDETEQSLGHNTCIVYIKDDKYGLDCFFVSDPTFGAPTEKRNQNMCYIVISPSLAPEIYGPGFNPNDVEWLNGILYERFYGPAPQLSGKPTVAEVQEYLRQSDEYHKQKNETIAKEPKDDLHSELAAALVQIALARGLSEAQAQAFAVNRMNANS